MRIAVMGAGGVGGYFGAKLALAGHDVVFIARGAHGAAIAEKGLQIQAPEGDFLLKPAQVVSDASAIKGAVDAVLFTVKLSDTQSAGASLKPLVDAGASVFTFQNGVESFERLGKILGEANVVPGVAHISAIISGPGVVKKVGPFARLSFGEADGKPSARTEALQKACVSAGFDVLLSPEILRVIWMKFIMLAPLAAMTALTRSPIGAIRSNPKTLKLLENSVAEAVAVGRALNVGLRDGDYEATMKTVNLLPEPMKASMAHDLEVGKPLELPGLSGAIVRLGARAGVPTPVHGFVCDALAIQENGRL